MWSDLTPPWQACVELAWEAYCDDCIPIGAVVTDAGGSILSRGRNRIYPRWSWKERPSHGAELAHAEVEALQRLDYASIDQHTCILYTTTEPCPMCMGTFYMSGVRNLHYAARDPWAGSVNLLGTTWYLSRKLVKAFGPDVLLEMIITGLFVEQDCLMHAGKLPEGDFYRRVREVLPKALDFGVRLWQSGEVQKLRHDAVPAEEMFNRLILLVK
jgi:tRNA(Arg) A34 adenosine deaminase TadA